MEAELIGDRLSEEPVVFRGYTDSELRVAIRLSVLAFVPPAFVTGAAVGRLGEALGVALLGIISSVWFGAVLLQTLKRGRPPYYLQQKAHLLLSELGLGRCEFHFRGDLGRFRFPDGSFQMSLGRDVQIPG